jgi:hypothetical protein
MRDRIRRGPKPGKMLDGRHIKQSGLTLARHELIAVHAIILARRRINTR